MTSVTFVVYVVITTRRARYNGVYVRVVQPLPTHVPAIYFVSAAIVGSCQDVHI